MIQRCNALAFSNSLYYVWSIIQVFGCHTFETTFYYEKSQTQTKVNRMNSILELRVRSSQVRMYQRFYTFCFIYYLPHFPHAHTSTRLFWSKSQTTWHFIFHCFSWLLYFWVIFNQKEERGEGPEEPEESGSVLSGKWEKDLGRTGLEKRRPRRTI